jgi:putative FmdB family regulatory protein
MPIYEFHCVRCNKLLSFFSRRVNVETLPVCPHCGERLSRQVSRFAAVRAGDSSDELGDAPLDEAKVQNAVERLGGSLDAASDDDPRQAAALMREFTEASGIHFNRDIQDAMRRIESGEDPEAVGAEMDEIIGAGEGAFAPGDRARGGCKAPPPTRDETLYDL